MSDPSSKPAAAVHEEMADYLLTHIVSFANEYEIEQGLTLQCAGGVVSGRLISGRRYLREMSALMKGAQEKSNASAEVIDAISSMYEGYLSVYDAPAGQEDTQLPPPRFIHLIEARWHAPGVEAIPTRGMLWRGRIDQVVGFTVGQFGG